MSALVNILWRGLPLVLLLVGTLSATFVAWRMYAPAVFYGLVVDRNGKPVANANVFAAGKSATWGDGPSLAVTEYQIRTGENGRFTVHSRKDQIAIVRIECRGVYIEPQRFGYGDFTVGPIATTRHIADRNKPVIFELRSDR